VAERTAEPAVAPTPASPERTSIALDPARDPGSQQRKADFLGSAGGQDDVNPHALTRAVSPYTLSAGSVIAASLITGINSDLPGFITAQVTQNAYDSVTGRTLLIPQGSRLIGSYDSVVAFGQKRALVVWQRIILPNGSSLRIDNMPASDARGFAGLADKVDLHTWQLLKGVVLSTLLGVGTELSIGGEGDLVRAIRESTQQSASRAGDQIVSKNLNIQPTITVRPGWARLSRPTERAVAFQEADQHRGDEFRDGFGLAAARRRQQGSGPRTLERMMLKLPKLPDRVPVKITISLTPELNQALADYAALYVETYGQPEPVAELIPAMLVGFLESDRAFSRARQSRERSAS
jgi:hypothetical protein